MSKCLINLRARIIYLAIFTIAIAISKDSFAFEDRSWERDPYKVTIEGQFSAFFPQSNRVRKIYGDCAPIYGIQFTKQFARSWEFWSGFSWYSKSSRHYRHCCHSTIKIPNLSFGVNYLWKLTPTLDIYLGTGPVFGIVFLNNHSCCRKEKTSTFAVGGVLRGAARWFIRPRVFVTVSADYSYQGAFFKKYANVGGTKIGGGFGFKF